jgi:hypothetical protein
MFAPIGGDNGWVCGRGLVCGTITVGGEVLSSSVTGEVLLSMAGDEVLSSWARVSTGVIAIRAISTAPHLKTLLI